MERDERYRPDDIEEQEDDYKTITVEDYEEKGEDVINWMEQRIRFKRWHVLGGALFLGSMPTYAGMVVLAYIFYRLWDEGFLFGNRYLKEAKIEK